MEVSAAIGLDETKTCVMVYVALHCGGLCGADAHDLLEKRDANWQPAPLDVSLRTWMS